MTRSIPSISSAGKDNPQSTTIILSSYWKAVMFIPICSRPPKGMIFRPETLLFSFFFFNEFTSKFYTSIHLASCMYPGVRMDWYALQTKTRDSLPDLPALFSKIRTEIRHSGSYDSIKITASLMPFVYSLSLSAQNHYRLKPAKHPVAISANHTNHVTVHL